MIRISSSSFCRNEFNEKSILVAYSSLVLRHKPSAAGITLDAHGWAGVGELLSGVRRTGRRIDMDTLFIVQWDQMAKLKYQLTSQAKTAMLAGHTPTS